MQKTKFSRAFLALILATFACARLSADVVETKGGARITGKVSKIDDGKVEVDTDYAGTIKIKQAEVVAITTDAPIAIRLASGTRLEGRITGGADGSLQITGADATLTTPVSRVAAAWPAGKKDPELVALEYHWTYEATADIAGKTGNREQLGTAAGFRAVRKNLQDALQFYAAYDRQISDGVKSADQFKAGVDYQNNFSGRYSWYTRDEGGFDRVKDVELYNIAAAGLGYDFIKEPKHTLTTRAGLSFRYEGYKNPATEDVKSLGLDFGLNHSLELAESRLVNRLSFVPAFDDFGNFRLSHESFYELPLTKPAWKLRVGVSNDYNSKPGVGIDKLDTTYFTRFVLSWQ